MFWQMLAFKPLVTHNGATGLRTLGSCCLAIAEHLPLTDSQTVRATFPLVRHPLPCSTVAGASPWKSAAPSSVTSVPGISNRLVDQGVGCSLMSVRVRKRHHTRVLCSIRMYCG